MSIESSKRRQGELVCTCGKASASGTTLVQDSVCKEPGRVSDIHSNTGERVGGVGTKTTARFAAKTPTVEDRAWDSSLSMRAAGCMARFMANSGVLRIATTVDRERKEIRIQTGREAHRCHVL